MSTFSKFDEQHDEAPTAPADSELFAMVARSDEAAFLKLYERHSRAVYLYCASILRSSVETEEACQEVWMAMWKGRKKIALATASALPWLLVTARYKAIDRYRMSRKHNSTELDRYFSTGGADETMAAVERDELSYFIASTVEKMPLTDRKLYEMCIVNGLPYAAAAIELELTPSAVKNRIHRLRSSLRAHVISFGGSSERN